MAVDRRIPRQEDIYGFILLQIRRLCENTLEILVWIEVVFLSRFDDAESRLKAVALAFAPDGVLAKSQFFLPMTNGLMLLSARLLSISSLPSSM